MTQTSYAELLAQAYANNWQQYLASLQSATRSGWDICVLTASDERQAGMYHRQLEWRRETGLLPPHTQFLVLADPSGQRIGSGAATLRVLRTLHDQFTDLSARRVLIIHSGGDSRRLPHCSAIGKLFARLPRELPDGRTSTIFDEFLICLSGLATELSPGVMIASGDVLLIFDHLQLTLNRVGVTGVAALAPVEMGTHHGVYAGGHGIHRVRAYLHKPSVKRMQEYQAITPNQMVQIDTGLVWLGTSAVQTYIRMTDEAPVARLCHLNGTQPHTDGSTLNLYSDLLLPLAESTLHADYLADASDGPITPDVYAAREVIWEHVRKLPFTMESLQSAMFIHFGTSQEYWQIVASDPAQHAICGWTARAGSLVTHPHITALQSLTLINTALEGSLSPCNEPALLVDSHLSGPFAWHGPAIVANTVTAEPLVLEPDIVVHQVPLSNKFVTRVFGMHDNPKLAMDSAGATFMNRPWAHWLAEANLLPEVLWGDTITEARSLWNAKLYPVCASRDESLRLALLLQSPAQLAMQQAAWMNTLRMSLQESFGQADGEQVLADVRNVEDYVASRRFLLAIQNEQPASEAKPLLGRAQQTLQRRGNLVSTWLAQVDPLLGLRAYTALAIATGDMAYEHSAFQVLSHIVQSSVKEPPHHVQKNLQKPQSGSVRVKAAARIDFGGGWTDTPPYSIEHGGTVLNAAVLLAAPGSAEVRHPIVAEATWLDEPRLILESRDIAASFEPLRIGNLLDYTNPADPFALHKAALVMRKLIPTGDDPARPIADLLRGRGVGMRLSTQTSTPRGSGLGTSSILAGTVLEALRQLLGEDTSSTENGADSSIHPLLPHLFDEVLSLEQMMTTGGGWQDQVGGLTEGIKLITSLPGLPQIIRYEPVHLSAQAQAELASRLILIYTGQQRLAKNLLRTMMGRWMARTPQMVEAFDEITHLARQMRDALLLEDITAFGTLIGQHWQVNKRMDPGCTNPFIDKLFEMARPYICGGKLCGAGGGGFAIMVARDARAAQDYAALLSSYYAQTPVGAWGCSMPDRESFVISHA